MGPVLRGQTGGHRKVKSKALVFAYAFGMKSEPVVQDLFSMYMLGDPDELSPVARVFKAIITPERIRFLKERYAEELKGRLGVVVQGLGGRCRRGLPPEEGAKDQPE